MRPDNDSDLEMREMPTGESSPSYDALSSDGWLAWNSQTWGLNAQKVMYRPDGRDYYLSGVLYVDNHGRVRMPPLNPYLPFKFVPTGDLRPERVSRQWEEVGALFARDLQRRKVIGRINLPPEFTDARPLQWQGLTTETRYTYSTTLPYTPELASRAVRKNVAKAQRAGYQFEATQSTTEVAKCLQSTAKRKGFEYRLDNERLSALSDLLDPSSFRTHLVRDNVGNVVSAGMRLLTAGGVALDWVQGTEPDALKAGAAQLMYKGVLEDLGTFDLRSFDYGGANIRAVAEAKAAWGMHLTPYITVTQQDARFVYRTLRGAARRITSATNRPPA